MHKHTAGQNSSGTKHGAASVFLQQYAMPTSSYTSYPLRLKLLIQPDCILNTLCLCQQVIILHSLSRFFFPFGNYNSLICCLNSLKQSLDISHYLYLLSACLLYWLSLEFHVHLKLNVYNIVQYFSGQNICNILKGQVWKNASRAFVIVQLFRPCWLLKAEFYWAIDTFQFFQFI